MDDIHVILFETDNSKIISIKIYDIVSQNFYAYGYSFNDILNKKKIYLKDNLYHDFIKINYKNDFLDSLIINRDVMSNIISYNVYDIFDMSKKQFCENFNIIEWIV